MSYRHRVGIAGLSLLLLAGNANADSPDPGALDLGEGVRIEVVRIPQGPFMMGSPAGEAGRRADEDQVQVVIDKAFLLGKYPITRGQFARFVNATKYRTEAEVGTSGAMGFDGKALVQRKEFNWRHPGFAQTDDHPVVCITYKDAMAFCDWVARQSGRSVSLPTERQWEYACRAGTTTRFHAGDTDADLDTIGWSKSNAGDGTRPVGQKKANAWGVSDMSGNVYEWCSDLYGPYMPGRRVVGEMDKPRNVLRGGSWFKSPADARSAARYRNTPGSRNADNGFRIVVGDAKASAPLPAVGTAPGGGPSAMPGIQVPGVQRPGLPVPPTHAPSAVPAMPPGASPGSQSPIVVAHSSSSGFGLGTLLCMLVPLLVLVGFVIFIIRAIAKRSSGPNQFMPPRMPDNRSRGSMASGSVTASTGGPPPLRGASRSPLRAADDGFWIDTAQYNAGDEVDVIYDTPAGRQSRRVTIEPSERGQFVYTGEPPSNLLMQGILLNEMLRRQQEQQSQYRQQTASDPTGSAFSDTVAGSSSHRSGHGFPSAY